MSASAGLNYLFPLSGAFRRLRTALFMFLSLLPSLAFAQEPEEDILAFRFTLGGEALAGPVAVGNRVWIISEDKTLYMLDGAGRAVGRRAWKDGVPEWIAPDPFGRALLPTADGSLIMVNRAGLEVFRVRPGALVSRAPAFGADGRFFAAVGRNLTAYSSDGRILWSADLPAESVLGPFTRFPSKGAARVAVGCGDGSVREYDEYGSPQSEISGDGVPTAWTAWAEGLVLLYRDGGVSFRDDEGREVSRVRLGAPPLAAGGDGDGAWVLFSGGRVVRVSSDGSVGTTVDTGITGAREVRVFPKRVLVLGPRGVASLSKDGQVFRDLALRNAPRLPAVTTSGIVLSAGEDWILYAYRFERDLGDAFVPPVGFVDFQEAKDRADEEAFWNPDFKYDDGILRELRSIEKSVGSASIGTEEPDALKFCSAIALGYGMKEASLFGGAAPIGPSPSSALPRAAACDILGELGSPRAVPVLTEAYLRDPDPAVRAGAARAIGTIGLDPSGEALRAFQWAADREYFLDESGALATIAAVEGVYRALGELSDPGGIRAIMKLAGKPYGAAVRARAQAALRRLSAPVR